MQSHLSGRPTAAILVTENSSTEHQERVSLILGTTNVMEFPRLSLDARTFLVVSSLCTDANGDGSAEAVRVALSDPIVLAVARSLMAEAVTR